MEDEQTTFSGYVVVPRDEYDDLVCARFCIDLIAQSFGRYGSPDSDIVKGVCSHFGFKFKEDSDA